MTIDKRKIKELAISGLNDGKTKEELYYEITSVYKDIRVQRDIANIIRFIPEKTRLKKYGIYNTMVIVLLIVIDLINLLVLNYGGLLWFGVLTYFAFTRKTNYYYWFAIIGLFIILAGLFVGLNDYSTTGQLSVFLIIGSAIMGLMFISVGIYLPKLLTPNYELAEENIIDSNGEKRKVKRIKYK